MSFKIPDCLLGVVLHDGRLVHEDVLLGVIAVDEAVAALHVEPLHGAAHLSGDNLKAKDFLLIYFSKKQP